MDTLIIGTLCLLAGGSLGFLAAVLCAAAADDEDERITP